MPNRDGIVSIGFDYKKDLEKMIKDFEAEMNAVSSNTQLSKGMKKQFDNILAEMREFKASMDKELANLGSGKVSQSSFKSFKQTVENKFKGIREDIDRLDLALNNLNTSIGILGNDFNLSKFSNEFEEARQRILSTNEAIDILFSKLDNQGISLFSIDNASLNESLDIIKKIEHAIKTVDSESSDKYDLKILNFDEKEAQSEADKISATIEFIKDKMDSLNESINNPNIGGIKLTKIKAEYEALSLELKKVYDKMDAFYNIDIDKVNFDPVFSDKAVSIFEDISEEFDGEIEKFIEKARLARKELKDLVDYSKGGTVKISNKLDANTSQVETTATIRTTSKDLWKILEPELDKLQKTLNSNPVIAPVKLVVAPTAVSSEETGNLKTSENYSKKYSKILAQTGEDAVVDLEGVYKKTFTSVMNSAVSYAKETIAKIQDVFDKNLIGVKFDISQEEIDKIQNFVLSNKDGKKVDISGQITKAKQEIEELNQSLVKTSELLQGSKGTVKFDGFEKFTQDITSSIGKLEELQNILKALQNIEITLAKASGIASITELDNQWANVEKRILNATKLDGSFRKNASISKIASEYQKYIDMGGTNSIGNIDKIKDNEETLNAILSKAKDFAKQDLSNNSVKELSIELDDVIGKFDELIATVKTATNALYKIIKQTGVSELDKQWSSITDKFKSIADNSGKINLSKQKKDVEELLVMYQRYVNMGGSHTPFDLTDNIETVRKLDKAYKKLNEVKPIDNSSDIKAESESFKQVEQSVDSLTKAIGDTKVQAINIEATAMEDAAEREILAINAIVDNLNMIVSKLKEIKGIKIPTIQVENVSSTSSIKMDTSNTDIKEEAKAMEQVAKEAKKLAEEKRKVRQEEKKSIQSSVNKALKEQLSSWKQIQNIREKINKSSNDGEISALKEEKKIYQQQYNNANRILKANSDLYNVTEHITNLEKIRLETNSKIASYIGKQEQSVDSGLNKQKTSYINKLKPYTDETKYVDDFIYRTRSLRKELEELNITKPEDVKRLKQIGIEIDTIISDSKLLESKLVKQDSKIADIISKMKIFRDSNTNMSRSQRADLQTLIDYATALEKSGKITAESMESIKIGFSGIKAQVTETGNTGLKFIDRITQRAEDINAKFFAQFFSWQDWIRYLREGFTIINEIDKSITELRKVSNGTTTDLNHALKDATITAKDLGASIKDIVSMQADWARLGYSIPESEELARVTQLYVNVGDNMSAESASENLISTLQGFQLEATNAEQIVDQFNEVANNFAIDTQGIGEALKRSAASFNAANTDLAESIALVTTANAVVQDPDSIGTTFKTLSARIRGAETELESLGQETDEYTKTTSKLRDLVQGLTGFDIMEDEDTFKSIYDIVLGIGKEWNKLSDIEQANYNCLYVQKCA